MMRQVLYFRACFLCAALLFAGCENKVVHSSSGASRGVPAGNNSVWGECNRLNLLQPVVNATIGTHYDIFTGKLRTDFINLNIKTAPSELWTDANHQIQFFRWSGASGVRQVNQLPVRMFFIDKLTGQISTQTVDRLSQATIDWALHDLTLTDLGITRAQFFARVLVVLTGIEMQYNAVTLAYYNTEVSAVAQAQADALLPLFALDPLVYKQSYPQALLYQLHPFYSYVAGGASMSDYRAMMNDMCQEVSGVGERVPASATSTQRAYPVSESFLEKLKSSWQSFVTYLKSLF